MQNTIFTTINKAIEDIKANKQRLEAIKRMEDYYATAEIRKQEQAIHEKNAQVLVKLKEKLMELKESTVKVAHEQEVKESQKSDAEISNIMAMLSLSANTMKEQEINDLYKQYYHLPLVKRSIEGVASTRHLMLDPVMTKSMEASEEFNRAVREYTQTVTPKEINENLEVFSTILTLTREVR